MFVGAVSGNQLHDFNPGIHPFPSGLFWTIPIEHTAVEVNLGAGRATLRGEHQTLRDFGSFDNSFSNGPSDPAVASYTVRWHDILDRRQVDDATFHVAGQFLHTSASIEWSATNLATGKTFTASPSGQTVVVAQLAHERNGAFFG